MVKQPHHLFSGLDLLQLHAGVLVTLLMSTYCTVQATVCDQLPTRSEIIAPIAQLESVNSMGAIPPSRFNLTFQRSEHFTCFAVRERNVYRSVSVALNYTTQFSIRSTNVQLILHCNTNETAWVLLDEANIRTGVDGEVFNLPTRSDCVDCLFITQTINRRRRQLLSGGCLGECMHIHVSVLV